VKQKGKPIIFDRDEHIRHDASRADFERLKPVFKTGGSVTAGNASGINDGAAALVLAGEATVKRLALKLMARIVSWGHAGVDPAVMGLGPIAAVRQALTRAGLRIADMDLIESNEAFAAQACAVSRELGLDSDKVNPNGSGISIGHPVGATGAINSVKAVYELQRTGGRYAVVTLCIGGGQGIAAIFERC
jgi:acetyl-CoA C-acetyltransferase